MLCFVAAIIQNASGFVISAERKEGSANALQPGDHRFRMEMPDIETAVSVPAQAVTQDAGAGRRFQNTVQLGFFLIVDTDSPAVLGTVYIGIIPPQRAGAVRAAYGINRVKGPDQRSDPVK